MTSPATDSLRSARYVTRGYRNALHRMYLYGVGLSPRELAQPFVGVALAHSEARRGHAAVRQYGDAVKQACWAAGATPWEFVVPVIAEGPDTAWRDGVAERELVADSTELVVRGHWYDALLGVVDGETAAVGMAMAMIRLRVPGLVVWPQAPAEPELGSGIPLILRRIGLMADGAGDVDSAVRAVLGDLDRESDAARHAEEALAEGTELPLPALPSPGLRDVAALLHELGYETLLPFLSPARGHDGSSPRVVVLELEGGPRIYGVADLPPGGAAEHHSLLHVSGPDGVTLRPEDETATASGGPSFSVRASADVPAGDEGRIDLLVSSEDEELLRSVTAGAGRVLVRGPLPVEELDEEESEALRAVLFCRHMGHTCHPGAVDGALRYDHL